MQCPNCGLTNPENARFCFECGTAFQKSIKMEYYQPSASTSCPKCGLSNPNSGKFCYGCGTVLTPLEVLIQPETRQCSTCGTTTDSSQLFCPNCSQPIVEKPLKPRIESAPVQSLDKQTECPACGQLTTGDYCYACGFNLAIHEQKRPADWWYCDRDSAIMAEIDPKLQILVSRISLDESLVEAIDNKLLKIQNREKARSIALQLFEGGVTTNFEALSQVRCPVCGTMSLAPTTHRPRQMRVSFPRYIALNASSICRNGLLYLRNYPQILLIFVCAIITDMGLIIFGLGFISSNTSNSLIPTLGIPLSVLPLGGISYSIIYFLMSIIISLISNSFFQCWYYTSLKELRHEKENSLIMRESFKNSFNYLPRVVAAQLAIIGIFFVFIFGFILAFIVGALLISSSSGIYQNVLLIIVFLLLGVIMAIILMILLTILFSYVSMSIVFDANSGVITSLKRSWRFARRYFWTTVGVYMVFLFLSFVIQYIQISISSPLYFLSSSSPLYLLIYFVSTRLVEAYRSMSLGWAYDEFKHTID